jgi:hypothetical protein
VTADPAVSRWLAATVRDPGIPEQDWYEGRPATLPTGVHFDAVKMHPDPVHAALATTVQQHVSDALAQALDGPVICHPRAWYYALVPPGAATHRHLPHAVVLGPGSWLGVPRIDRTHPSLIAPYWAVAPAHTRHLTTIDTLVTLLRTGHHRLRYPDHEGRVHPH